MTTDKIIALDMARDDYEKRNRNREIRENNRRTGPKPTIPLTECQYKTYRAGQVWTAFFVGLLGGWLISLVTML